ncbi:hypothetical protein SLS62_006982 [Diatrype stigma]|uniref:Uncharacterized protein n=1 Tax=Diatrype stigma TaxID=117547 RepID=A0AAN9UQN7_9PEZI
MPTPTELFNAFLALLCTILIALIFYLDPISVFGTAERLQNMPLIINRRGGALAPYRGRVPVPPPIPQPDTQQEGQQSKAPDAEASGSDAEHGEFEPRPKDVMDVRLILEKSGKLPPEVADMVIELAEYWACSATSADYTSQPGGHLTIRGAKPGEDRFLELWRREAKPRLLPDPAPAEGAEDGGTADFEYPKAVLEALAGEPLPDLEHPVRKVVFDILSRDQGWGGSPVLQRPYAQSFTWFDAGLERFDRTIQCPEDCPDRADPKYAEHNIPTCAIRSIWPPSVPADDPPDPEATTPASPPTPPAAEPSSTSASALVHPQARYHHALLAAPDHCIQHNRLAVRAPEHHRVEWRATDDIDPESAAAAELVAAGRGSATGDGAFVRALKLGDMITVWGRARFPGWSNNVEKVEVRVYWAV